MQMNAEAEQVSLFDHDFSSGKMCQALSAQESQKGKTSGSSSKRSAALSAIPYQSLDLTPGNGNLLGESYWEILSPSRGASLTLNTGASPREEDGSTLSQIVQADVQRRYYLSRKACRGILRRAHERGKPLPPQLEQALKVQAGLIAPQPILDISPQAWHINQREETIDLGETAGALLATRNMQMQTFVSRPAASAFAENQRNEVRDLQNRAGALCSSRGGKQQTYIASFNAGAGACAGTIGYGEECTPTLKAMQSGNMMPAVLCLNDQGDGKMDCTEELSGTLRAQEHGHQPLVMGSQQGGASVMAGICPTITAAAGMSGNNQPVLFENHGIDSRYTGPHPVAPAMSARYGTGGNNVPLVTQEDAPVYCITGNAIDRQPQNGGNGIGYQENIAYTLTATDHHAVYCRQRVDEFRDSEVTSTQSARQHKDATDLVLQETVGALTSSDRKGPNNQYVSQDKCVCDPLLLCRGIGASGTDDGEGIEGEAAELNQALPAAYLIRRLTPLECERLQGYPDGWTNLSGASDSARYKALGNSVAIPCVEYVLQGVALALKADGEPEKTPECEFV